jgi:hypothetical protein
LGPKTATESFAVTLSNTGIFASAFGSATSSAASSDTADSGFISLFKRFLFTYVANWGIAINPWFAKSNTYFRTITVTKAPEAVTYAAGDVYGTKFELTNFGASDGSVYLVRIIVASSLASLPSGMGSFKVFLFDSEPIAIADNAAFTLSTTSITPQGILLNSLSLVTFATAFTSQTSQINELIKRNGSANFWGYFVTQSGFTPVNSVADTMAITFASIEA